MTAEQDIEALACKLRRAAFPGATGWAYCGPDTRDRWIATARAAWAWRDETRPERAP